MKQKINNFLFISDLAAHNTFNTQELDETGCDL